MVMSRRGRRNWKNLQSSKNIAKILILHRIWNGLNQTKLAEDIQTSFQQYQKIERCYNRIFAEQLDAICKSRNWNHSLFFTSNPEDLLEAWNKADIKIDDTHWEKDPNNDGMTKLVSNKYERVKKLFQHIDDVAENNYFGKRPKMYEGIPDVKPII
tara:strand:- start:296 stop:763 length:468 start_codon:yes stop_codon:yes gene_type:complete